MQHRDSWFLALLTTCCFLLCLAPVASAEAPAAATAPTPTEASSPTPRACPSPVTAPGAAAPVEVSIGSPIAPAYCLADCDTYPDLSVSCSGTCSKTDRNCTIGQRGSVTNCSGQTTFCGPVCEPCIADCTEGPDVSVSCSGSCTVVDQNCGLGQTGYVQCNGVKTYCAACSYCPNELCQAGQSCTSDDDCCANFGPSGSCFQGQCECPI